MSHPTSYLLERAWVEGEVRDDVLVEIEDGRFTSVTSATGSVHSPGVATAGESTNRRSAGDSDAAAPTLLAGLTVPGLANCHSHAFHRALRGRTQRGQGTFWTWREQMYDVAARLDPDSYLDLATATFREMVAAGITAVGEFHYLHHQPDGTPYDDPNAMSHALVEAADRAGLRLTLLDTCYLTAGIGRPPEGVQRRFSDGDVDAWADRLGSMEADPDRVRVAGAYHSVRAVPLEQMRTRTTSPLHIHLSEQVAENEECLAAYGMTPTQVFAEAGHLGPHNTLVHATHLTDDDIRLIGEAGAFVDFCPTTERDLGDGIGPGVALRNAGARLTVGSDSHAVIDLFEELRAVELDERLASQQRGHWSAGELLDAGTTVGHRSLGWADAGAIAVGQRADLVTIATDRVRTAGTGADEHTAVFAAVAEDVAHVVIDGRVVFGDGDRERLGRDLTDVVGGLWR